MSALVGVARARPGRNDPCSCGSGKKYKKCCASRSTQRLAEPPPEDIARLGVLAAEKRHLELETGARELLRRHPESGALTKLVAVALWAQGKEVLPYLQRTVELTPDDAEAHTNLGNAERSRGRFESAVASHRRALEIKPDYAEAQNNLGSALQDLARLEEATACFRRAVVLKPDFALAHSNLGNVLALQSELDESEASCRRALELNPSLAAAIVQLAEIYATRAQFTEAERLLRRALAVEPDMPEALAGLVRWRKLTAGDAGRLKEAQRIVQGPQAPRRELHLRYAMGKYFDDVGEYAQAFENYRRANELSRMGRPAYDREQTAAGIGRLLEAHDEGWVHRAWPAVEGSERAVFIVGMPRSGTTLAEQILASQTAVFGAGELPFWNGAAPRYAAARAAGEDESAVLSSLAEEYLTMLRGLSADASRVVDKMPGNFLYLGLLRAALPGARIIHLRRNPIDTCLSIYFQNFSAVHSYANDLEDLAHYYGEYVRLMEHWRRILPPGAMLEVTYEELVDDPQTWSRRMLEFSGLPWDASCLEFHRSVRPVSTFSKWQARQKIHSASIQRWRHYEPFVQPLRHLVDSASPPPASSAREHVRLDSARA